MLASTIGTTVEAYDFLLYTAAVPLVFSRLFFPTQDPLSGVLLGFATQFVGFAARPLGAVIFGTFGDRVGRKSTLIVTLFTMCLSSAAVGVLPTYQTAGVAASFGLTALRILTGIGLGGEWAGAVLLSMEWGKTSRRGLVTAITQIGQPLAIILANGGLVVLSRLTGSAFLDWGWRVAFLSSLVLLVVGVYIRLGVLETPPFTALLERRRIEPAPVRTAIAGHPRELVLVILVKAAEQAPFYIFTSFVFLYGTQVAKFGRSDLLVSVLAGSALGLVTLPIFGYLSDLLGRKLMIRAGLFATALFAFPYFWLLDQRAVPVLVPAVVASLLVRDLQFGPQAAFIAESFTGRIRYTGASIGFNFASLIAGGAAPLIAAGLLAAFGSAGPIALYLVACSLVGFVALALLPDRSRFDHGTEYDEIARGPISTRSQRAERVFLSYAAEDAAKAATFKAALQRHFGEVFDYLDARSIRHGKPWREEVFDSLERAEIGIPLMSRAYFVSGHCRTEAHAMLDAEDQNRMHVFPVRLDDVVPPNYLAFKECRQLRPNSADDIVDAMVEQLL